MENKKKDEISIDDILEEENQEERDKKYNKYVKSITPMHNVYKNVIRAFIVGGAICTLGEAFVNLYIYFGASKEDAKLYNLITLIFLTALNIYSKIGKFAGAGSIVPITGFANSVAAPAVEYKSEGQVFGIGCKIFTIAGPVILYGVLSSWILGLIYYIFSAI